MTGKNFRYWLEAAALRIPLALFRLLGLDRASATGGWLARRVGPRLGVTRRARRNIARAMPELSAHDIERIIADMWENLGRTMAEYAHLDKFSLPAYHARLEIVGTDVPVLVDARGQGALFISGHFANWELMPLTLPRLGYQGGGEVYRHANNPRVNDWMVSLRERHIMARQIPKGAQGAREILKLLKKNKFIAMLADQKMNDGIEARFFGLKAMTTSAPAALAVRYGSALVPACIERTQGAYFRITLYPPIIADASADPAAEIARLTQQLNNFLEERIRARPHEWLWLHNRWPADDS